MHESTTTPSTCARSGRTIELDGRCEQCRALGYGAPEIPYVPAASRPGCPRTAYDFPIGESLTVHPVSGHGYVAPPGAFVSGAIPHCDGPTGAHVAEHVDARMLSVRLVAPGRANHRRIIPIEIPAPVPDAVAEATADACVGPRLHNHVTRAYR